jgi:hypothetical protein
VAQVKALKGMDKRGGSQLAITKGEGSSCRTTLLSDLLWFFFPRLFLKEKSIYDS